MHKLYRQLVQAWLVLTVVFSISVAVQYAFALSRFGPAVAVTWCSMLCWVGITVTLAVVVLAGGSRPVA